MDENYSFIAQELGDPVERLPFSEQELAYCAERLPPRLVEFMQHSGHANYLGGAVTVCPPSELAPILALIFKGDPDLDHRDCSIVSYSAFGHLAVWSNKHRNISIHLPEGEIHSVALAPTEFAPGLLPKAKGTPDPNVVACGSLICDPDEYDFFDIAGEDMFERCIEAHGPPELGECYGFFPALGLTSVENPLRRVENIKRVKALEHFALLAQIQPFNLTNMANGRVQKVREVG